MLISHRYKFLFVSVPKTGTVSMLKALHPYGDVFNTPNPFSPLYLHNKAEKIKKLFIENGWNWDEYFKFGFVRNPWDSLVSQYFYKINFAERQKTNAPYNKLFMLHCKKFKYLCKDFNSAVISNMLTTTNQKNWVFDDKNKNLLNFIGRFENMDQDFKTACEKINLPQIELKRFNRTTHENYKTYYTEETIKIIEEKFKEDIRIFNYKFDGFTEIMSSEDYNKRISSINQ